MQEIFLDKSRTIRLRARINEASVPRVLVFQNEDGSAHDISSYDFELIVFKRVNSLTKLFTLTIGAGLTVQGASNNELLIEITAAQATQKADTYFWRLYSVDEDHTWLNGPFEFHQGESDNVESEETVNIYQNG
jgi:hypothetical protein